MTFESQTGSARTSGELAAQAARWASVQAARSDLPVRGSMIAPAASSTSSRNDGTPLASNSGPLTAESTLSMSTAFSSIDRRVLLGPLGRADQAVFLGVPARVQERPPRLPAILDGRPQRTAHFQRRRRAAARVDRAVDPGVAVVADHDPAIGLDRAGNRGDHVPDRANLIIHRHRHPRPPPARDRRDRPGAAPLASRRARWARPGPSRFRGPCRS